MTPYMKKYLVWLSLFILAILVGYGIDAPFEDFMPSFLADNVAYPLASLVKETLTTLHTLGVYNP